MTSLRGLMTEKRIGIKTITEFEAFPEDFRTGQDSADIIYLVQCEVLRMRENIQYNIYFQDKQAPIPY
jgi:hypothetical protein